jgi:hypothetical protein
MCRVRMLSREMETDFFLWVDGVETVEASCWTGLMCLEGKNSVF